MSLKTKKGYKIFGYEELLQAIQKLDKDTKQKIVDEMKT